MELLNIDELNLKVLNLQKEASDGRYVQEITGAGVALLKDVAKGVTSSGKPKFSGHLSNQADTCFQVWNNKAAFDTLDSGEIRPGMVVAVNYSVGKFGLVLESIHAVEGFDPEAFQYHKYDCGEEQRRFYTELKSSGISSGAMMTVELLLHMGMKDFFSKRFGLEQAGNNNHDAVASGLMVHCRKMLQIYNRIKDIYPFMCDSYVNDLLVTGIAVHDMGKVLEMIDGVYQQYSFVTHRGFGVEMLAEAKPRIVELCGEEYYYHLMAILMQHHDEFRDTSAIYKYRTKEFEWLGTSELDMLMQINGRYYAIEYDGKHSDLESVRRDMTKDVLCKDNTVYLIRVRCPECRTYENPAPESVHVLRRQSSHIDADYLHRVCCNGLKHNNCRSLST